MGLYSCKRDSQNTTSTVAGMLWFAAGTAVSVLLFHWFYDVKAAMLLMAIIMISVSWQVAAFIGENSFFRWLSGNNLTIYIYSWPFQAVIMVIAGKLGFSWYLMALSMFIVGMTAPVLMVLVYKKFKVLNNRFFDLLIGMK